MAAGQSLETPPSPDMSVRVSQLAHQNTVRSSLTAKQPVSQCGSALAAASAKILPERIAARILPTPAIRAVELRYGQPSPEGYQSYDVDG